MRFVYCLLALLLGSSAAFATHIMGGYIRATPVAGQALTYQITVTMYYNVLTGSAAAEASNDLSICFGDNGKAQQIQRTSVRLASVGQASISINEYTATYTYSSPAVYSIQATAINRTDNLRNISGGAGAPQAFSLRTTIQVGAGSQNQTPVFSLPATGLMLSLNQRASLALGATDADGDSLSYSLATPLTSPSDGIATDFCSRFTTISAYQFPNDVAQKGVYRLNPKTGLLTWDVPTEQGQYAVAILVAEWRNGTLISQTQHEVLITVVDRGGTPVAPPAYEPAQLSLITAIPDADLSTMRLRVSPNPVAGENVQVDVVIGNAQSVTMDLLDSQGRIYKTVHSNQPSTHHHYLFDLAGNPAGLYLIRAKSGGQQVVRKVLKQ